MDQDDHVFNHFARWIFTGETHVEQRFSVLSCCKRKVHNPGQSNDNFETKALFGGLSLRIQNCPKKPQKIWWVIQGAIGCTPNSVPMVLIGLI